MHIVFVQPLLPKYSISFFNRLSLIPNLKVTVLADIKNEKQLNQYNQSICNFDVLHIAEVAYGPFILRPGLGKLIAELNYDHLVLNANPRDISQLRTLIVQRLKGKAIFSWGMFHRIGKRKLVTEFIFKLIGLISTKCLVYTKKGIYSQLCRGIKIDKLKEIGTAIDEREVISESESKSSLDVEAFRKKHNLLGYKLILQVVRLSEIKKPELLVAAAVKIIEKDKNIKFILIGGGELESKIQNMVSTMNLQENFILLGPIYDESLLSLWFLISDIFVVPTCIGLSAHHAMCYKLPIITDNDYSQQASEFEILSDGLNAIFYESGNIDDLSDKIMLLLGDDYLRKRISENAYHTVKDISNLQSKVDNMASVFIKLGIN